MPDPLPLYLNVDGVYAAKALSQPWGDVVAAGVVFGGAPAGLDPLKVDQITPAGMGVQIAPGVCWIANGAADDSAAYYTGGAWRAVFLASQQLPVSAAHATLPRIDRVVAEVLDSQFGAGGDLARLRVIAGTAAASPVAPALPRTALSLATVAVAAAATSIVTANITDTRSVSAVGGRARAGLETLGEVTLAAASAQIDFLRIPQNFSALVLIWDARAEAAGTGTNINCRMNGDSGSNYDSQSVHGSAAAANAAENLGATSAILGVIPLGTPAAARWGGGWAVFPNYADSAHFQTFFSVGGRFVGNTSGDGLIGARMGAWRNAAPVTSLSLTTAGNFAVGTRATLLGIRAA